LGEGLRVPDKILTLIKLNRICTIEEGKVIRGGGNEEISRRRGRKKGRGGKKGEDGEKRTQRGH